MRLFRYLFLSLLMLFPLLFSLPCAAQEVTSPEEEVSETGWGLYFGLLHSHSSLSGQKGSAEEAFRQAHAVEGLDFFAITDRSHTFDNANSGSITADGCQISADWAAGKAAAEAVTDSAFVGIFGYEMSWDNGLGHISTFCTPGFQSWQQEDFRYFRTGLQNYYDALTTAADSVSQFNHPDGLHGHFRDFDFYTEAYDAKIPLLEVGCGSDYPITREFYHRALAKGWHVAPTMNLNEQTGSWGIGKGRTVVYAHSLTEAGIFDALRNRRVYATEDNDLSIYYSMDGQFMGSRLKRWAVGENADILVTLEDPTDFVGKVEVIAEGQSIAEATLDGGYGTLSFSLPPEYAYYYLFITQPDGDCAITAPIWLEGEEFAGISNLSWENSLPVQGQPLDLALEIYNNEYAELKVTQVDISVDGAPLLTLPMDVTLNRSGRESLPVSLNCDAVGQTRITVAVSATLNGAPRTYHAELTVSFRKPEMVTDLLIDGTHGNAETYPQMAALAVKNQIAVHRATEEITAEMLEKASILLIPPPERPFSEEFLSLVSEFVGYGGDMILCGGGEEQNRLLETLGASIRFTDSGENRYLDTFRADSPWCAGLLQGQLYCCGGSIQGGNPIVADALAVEETGGGRIFVGSGWWLSDAALEEPKNIWDPPSANTTILSNILGSAQVRLPLTSIVELRNGDAETLYRIRGYATSGTANPHNTFENTLYIQDETGGIPVEPFTEPGISVGTPMEILGTVTRQGKNLVLKPISCEILEAAMYRYLPLEGDWNQLMNNELHGGELAQIEGTVVTFRPVGTLGISELVLEDGKGNFATVHIEDYIFSGATGANELAWQLRVGQRFRAIGIVHMREDGVSVLRVRNCDEVVYVPPLRYYWEPHKADNPPVGDSIGFWIFALLLSATLLRKMRLCKPHCK